MFSRVAYFRLIVVFFYYWGRLGCLRNKMHISAKGNFG